MIYDSAEHSTIRIRSIYLSIYIQCKFKPYFYLITSFYPFLILSLSVFLSYICPMPIYILSCILSSILFSILVFIILFKYKHRRIGNYCFNYHYWELLIGQTRGYGSRAKIKLLLLAGGKKLRRASERASEQSNLFLILHLDRIEEK